MKNFIKSGFAYPNAGSHFKSHHRCFASFLCGNAIGGRLWGEAENKHDRSEGRFLSKLEAGARGVAFMLHQA
jgi:hypothetical protein